MYPWKWQKMCVSFRHGACPLSHVEIRYIIHLMGTIIGLIRLLSL
jgi:hypothetical protein